MYALILGHVGLRVYLPFNVMLCLVLLFGATRSAFSA